LPGLYLLEFLERCHFFNLSQDSIDLLDSLDSYDRVTVFQRLSRYSAMRVKGKVRSR
jgi:hypothetical protein